MADQLKVDAAKKYLESYKDKFPEDSLVKQLLSSGYTQEEIDEARSLAVSSDAVAPNPVADNLQNNNIDLNNTAANQVDPMVSQPNIQPVQTDASSFVGSVSQPVGQPNMVEPSPQQMVGSDFNYGNSSSSKKKVIISAVVGVVLIVLGVVGYGYWNGSNIKNFAKKAREYNETVKSWEVSFNPDFEKVSKDSAEILAELKKGAPGKAKRLHTNLTEYFTHSKSLADSLKDVDEDDYYTKDLEDLVKKEDIEFMENSDKIKDEIEEDVEKLEKVSFSF